MFAIAVTDNDWFLNVRSSAYHTVNFWTPTPWSVRKLKRGDRWYFMRKSPVRRVGGYGVFVRYREMTVKDAWRAYEKHNGMGNETLFDQKIESLASKRSSKYLPSSNHIIGCVELSDVVTTPDLSHIDIIDTSHEFPTQIVKYKYFSGNDEISTHI